ncbi:chromatin assembly factor 1 subunit A-A isoform X2 [Halyomorpha halys]|uniref:chromatin assembly factor 1 subunit A-A isoform X2 n=1 Tax=Halyomorpha halys TaxID=286706 RepID=UPI0034D20170
MGLEDENGPPKKKLKQAQLCFGTVTLKSQKRKLSSDLNDDVHANKIVCKETEKENVEINNKSLCGFSESRKKSEEKKELDSISRNSPEKLNTSKSEPVVDLTEDLSTSQNKEMESIVKEDDTSLKDFSLVISDSVLNSINNKSVGSESNPSGDNVTVEKNSGEIDSCQSGLNDVEVESDILKEDPADKTQSLDESLNRTLNSEDDDFAFSSEESPKNKSSPGNPSRKLTPKRLESLKRKEERERLRLERQALRTKAKEEKLKLKQEKEDLKRKEREEKEKKRQAELKIKEEEKRLKEEERKKKEEEKKLKDEERKQKEEERRRKEEAKEEEKRKKEGMTEKEKAAFVNFFIAKKKQQSEGSDKPKESEEVIFMPFPMKSDMRLATNVRRVMSSGEKASLDTILSEANEKCQDLYLKELKSGAHLAQQTEATWPVVSQEEEHDVIIIESTADGECIDLTNTKVINNKKKMKAKLLQFHDNRRPPYWGTWRKKSSSVGPRKPLGIDKKTFDYEVDSDSEWEDEGEGEDIDKAGDSDEEPGEEEENQNSGENGYLLDNTFVPHGYLSDEEVHPDEEVDENNPENLKLRMKLLKQEFDEEMKSKTERLKPRLLGCVWISNGTTEVSTGSLYEALMRFRAVWNEELGSIDLSGPEIEESPTSVVQTKCKPFPPVVLPILAKFVHGNNLPLSGLIREFLLKLERDHLTETITKRAISLKIKEIASKTYDSSGKSVWGVNADMCEEYGLKVINNSKCSAPPSPIVLEKPKESLLVNFLKGASTPQPVKKRVALIPVPSDDCTPVKKEIEKTVHVATPRPTVENVIKKRAQLITLSRTPDCVKAVPSVHVDTPRPSHAPSNANIETVDPSTDCT